MPAILSACTPRFPRSLSAHPRALAGVVSALLVVIGCGQGPKDGDVTARGAGSGPETEQAGSAGIRSVSPSAVTSSGSSPHTLYAANGFQCADCHPCGVRSPDGHAITWMDEASPSFHAFSANSNLAGCQGCHGGALDGVGGSTVVSCAKCHDLNLPAGVTSWKTNCVMCHGGVGSASGAPPKTVWGQSADQVRVGTHASHLDATHGLSSKLSCGVCHPVPADALSPGHANGTTADVVLAGLAVQGITGTATWTRSSATCSNTYCHGATLAGGTRTSPVWTTADGTMRACNACHGAPPPAPHTSATNCDACHPGYSGTTVNPTTHIDGTVQVTSSHPAGWSDKAQHGFQVNLTGLAGCKACHGADLAGGTSGISCAACHASAGYAGWDTNCTFCHGNRSTGRQSPPVDIQGRSVVTNTSVGRHDKHAAPAMSRPFACAECHPARAGSVILDAAHLDGNGIAEVAFARTGTYTRTSATAATCASTYCHGNFTGGNASANPSWVSTTAMTCTSCHDSPPDTGRHSTHQRRGFACTVCHGSGYTRTGTSTGTVNATLHVNGSKDVPTGAGSGSTIRTWVNPSCTPTDTKGCHAMRTW